MANKPACRAPHSMEPYDHGTIDAAFTQISNGEHDLGALSVEQQTKLNQFKIQTRVANETYLRKHPEISVLVSGFLSSCLSVKPDNIEKFASEYFTDPQLSEKVISRLKNRKSDQAKADLLRASYNQQQPNM